MAMLNAHNISIETHSNTALGGEFGETSWRCLSIPRESLIDALTFWAAGYRNVTASYGTSSFTDDHRAAFERHGIERVLIAYDRDEAGNNGAEVLAKTLIAEGIECFRVLFPKGMDASEYAMQVKPTAKSLGVALRSAQWLGEGQAPTQPIGLFADVPFDAQTDEILSSVESSSEPNVAPALAAQEGVRPEMAQPTTASPQPADEIEAIYPNMRSRGCSATATTVSGVCTRT